MNQQHKDKPIVIMWCRRCGTAEAKGITETPTLNIQCTPKCDWRPLGIVPHVTGGVQPLMHHVVKIDHMREMERKTEPVVVMKKDSGPPCTICHSETFRSGSCYLCDNCGSTTGCG